MKGLTRNRHIGEDVDANTARIFEVGPRDGLQNEDVILEVDQKVEMIERLVAAGHTDVEIGSFVHPKWVPQMAATGEVVSRIERKEGVRYWALVPNQKGLERALGAGLDHIATFMSATEAHNQSNLNRSLEESLTVSEELIGTAKAQGCEVRAYLSTVFGCPYEGAVDFDRVMDICAKLLDFGADLISLGDTIGAGTPPQVEDGCRRTVEAFGADRVALHLHDTQGLGLTNAYVAWQVGMRQFDSAVGGTGGCPYAPSAAGNLGSEDLVHMFDTMGIETGVSLDELVKTSAWLDEATGISPVSRYYEYRANRAEGICN
ncbi:hydroxymethylglutaryl-CoA lyase [Persicimonas caeni]|uniref:Hydroxymethylglutaryl-CoA lyase n=1 Tax=Persicimonas caeni TaxID=2292766 RepID=A0A4Y6PQZ0_PERCE|nr:hydroxymethylglutaryl-CoA lyase [Persicimonas caeni]QED31965.1 hydroxymethylglutaryl-CoA lyase [Persicimonas caeni]